MGKLCQYCNKREAKIHFTEIKEGKKTEMHICEQCAHEKNMVLAFPSLPVLSQIMKGGPAVVRGESEAVPATCPSCGLPYTDFKAKGRLGCPACYRAFAPVLVPLLEKVHGTANHHGKTPERVQGELESRQEIAQLEDELNEAVRTEQYERAAELRDRIRELKEDASRES
ncbi:MAG: UvrB/UvrC motif-containing protein [Planctomycetota bacterium]|jgi:protein arginine kinase activator